MALSIPGGLVSLRALNASVVAVGAINGLPPYDIDVLVLDDNALDPQMQAESVTSLMAFATTMRVLSCQRCGLEVDVSQLIPASTFLVPGQLQELHMAQVVQRRRAQTMLAQIQHAQKSTAH